MTKLEQINAPDVPEEWTPERARRALDHLVEAYGDHLEFDFLREALDRLEQAARVFQERGEVAHKIEDALDASRKAIAAERDELRALLEWRPIETAPKDGTKILARIGGDTALIYWVGDELGRGAYPWCRDCECSGVYHPEGAFTHWLPLPPPPEGKR